MDLPITVDGLNDTVEITIDLGKISKQQRFIGVNLRNANRDKIDTVYVHNKGITCQVSEGVTTKWLHFDDKQAFLAAGYNWIDAAKKAAPKGPELSMRADAVAEQQGGFMDLTADDRRYLVAVRDALRTYWDPQVYKLAMLKEGDVLIDRGNHHYPVIMSPKQMSKLSVVPLVRGIYKQGEKPVGESLILMLEAIQGEDRPYKSDVNQAARQRDSESDPVHTS